MVVQAQQQTAQLLDQNEIVQTAYQRAEDIMKQAAEEAQKLLEEAQLESEQMRRASLAYTNDLLAEAQRHVEESLKETENKHLMLASALKNSIQVMKVNREELLSQLEPEKYLRKQQTVEAAAAETKEPAEGSDDEFYVPENAFLKENT